jgi:hypothetical protein
MHSCRKESLLLSAATANAVKTGDIKIRVVKKGRGLLSGGEFQHIN